MALRWCATGMFQADHRFLRVNGHWQLPALRGAFNAHFNANVSAAARMKARTWSPSGYRSRH